MAEPNDNNANRGETILQIRRCACVVKGGRRFSFSALVVVGGSEGSVGIGYAKAPEVPIAVEKAVRVAQRNMVKLPMRTRQDSRSIEHEVEAKVGASRVLLLPAGPGTGLIAGGVIRSVLAAAGYTDILSKSKGSSNPATLARATLKALSLIRNRQTVRQLRGV